MKKINFAVSDELHKSLRLLSAETGESITKYLTALIRRDLERRAKQNGK